MTYTNQDLSPYSSHLLARKTDVIADLDAEIQDVLDFAMLFIIEAIQSERSVTGGARAAGDLSSQEIVPPWTSTLPIPVVAAAAATSAATGAAAAVPATTIDLHSAAYVYEEDRPVAWLPANASRDKLHHLLMVSATHDGLMLLTSTDAEHRSVLLNHLKAGTFPGWKPFSQALLIKALVEDQKMRTLWLAGVHRDTAIKPSSKILSGYDLAEAIDPMNDSSYLAGAVRSTKGGVSLRNSSAWTGPNPTLQSFEERAAALLSSLKAAVIAAPPSDLQVHVVLANRIDDMSAAKSCYFISHADPETLDGSSGRAKAKRLTERFAVELNSLSAPTGKQAWAFSALVTEIATRATAVIAIEPHVVDDEVEYSIDSLPPAPFDEWAIAVIESSSLLKVYYETAHTIAGGTLSKVRLQASPFSGFKYCDFTGYVVTQEKPLPPMKKKKKRMVPAGPVPIKDMMTAADKSLFKWIFKEGLPLLGLNPPSPKKCWLYCDDGSSEVADFVHLDIGATPKKLTLFHAKGASSDKATRRAAPGPYELVASQAVKNLRAFDVSNLQQRIKDRLRKNGDERIWNQAWAASLAPMPNSAEFEAALNSLGSNYDCEVIIVQPHVRKTDFDKRVGKYDTVGASQLRTLLFGVESTARAVNAKFRVVADAI